MVPKIPKFFEDREASKMNEIKKGCLLTEIQMMGHLWGKTNSENP